MTSTDKSTDNSIKSKTRRLPPLVLPDSELNSIEFKSRLKTFIASSHAFKWDLKTNINLKTKKFLARNGFHSLFWSAILTDKSINDIIKPIFNDNILYISDQQFEKTFGVSLDPKAPEVSPYQLNANYFLLFALPAKSHSQYLTEWTKRRLKAFFSTIGAVVDLDIDCRPELFVETKRRFYLYPDLVPSLTRYVLNSFEGSVGYDKELFRQIKLAISYSGLQIFYYSWLYSNHLWYKSHDLDSVKEDINRITSGRSAIIAKYGENMLPFARLMNYPEVSQLNRCHYPDLAVCAYYRYCEDYPSFANISFRKIKTKTSVEELKRLSGIQKDDPFSTRPPTDFTEEEKSILRSIGLLQNEMFNNLTTFVNPYQHLDLFSDDFDD